MDRCRRTGAWLVKESCHFERTDFNRGETWGDRSAFLCCFCWNFLCTFIDYRFFFEWVRVCVCVCVCACVCLGRGASLQEWLPAIPAREAFLNAKWLSTHGLMLDIPRGCVTNQSEKSTRSWGITHTHTHTLEPAAYKVMCLFLMSQALGSQRGSVCVRGGLQGTICFCPSKCQRNPLTHRKHFLL